MSTTIAFPLYTELKELETPDLTNIELTGTLAKINQLESSHAEILYAIMQTYATETSSRSQKPAKERFAGSWLSATAKRGVRFKVEKVPMDLKILLAKYILYITGDERIVKRQD